MPRLVLRPSRSRPRLEPLEDRAQPAAVGAVAFGDVIGAGIADLVTATAPGVPVRVQAVYGGDEGLTSAATPATLDDEFPSYLPPGLVVFDATPFGDFSGGASVACGDVSGDGVDDVVVGAGAGGGPHVKVYDGRTQKILFDHLVYDAGFSGGVSVAAADLDADGRAEVIVGAGAGGGPHVKVFASRNGEWVETHSFHAFAADFRGGVSLSAGRLVNRDNAGKPYLVVGAGTGGGPHVRVFDLSAKTPSRVAEFLAGDESSRAGVDVAAVAGTWIDGRIAASAAAGAGGVVRLYALNGNGGAALDSTVTVAGQPGDRLTVAGGGFVYPDVPVLAVAAVGGQTATVVGVQATGDFLTWEEFNTQVVGPGAATIAAAPADPDALAVLPALGIDPGTFTLVDLAPKGGTTTDEQPVVTGFVRLGMVPAPARVYKSPYTPAKVAADVIRDFSEGDRADPTKWVGESTGPKDKYGPLATVFPVEEWVTALTPQQQAERLVAAAAMLIGTPYQHHHAPTWLPDLDHPWVPAPVSLKQTPGTDCSNFTGFLYNYALGIQINTDVEKVATETSGKQKVKQSDGSVETRDVSIVVTNAPSTRDEAAYQKLLDELQPGDLLHIAGTSPITGKASQDNPPKAAHAIMWLGSLATGPDGDKTPLIVDCTGPEHTDADGIHPPMGVHIRPFGFIGANSWYFQDLISYSRILPAIPKP